MKIVFSIFAITLLLVGCAVVQRPYSAPASGDVAYLRITDGSGRGLAAKEALIATFERGENCQGRYWMQGGPTQMKQTEVTTAFAKIPAGRPFSFAVHHAMGTFQSCVPIARFVPTPGRYYHAALSPEENSCLLSLESADSASLAGARIEPFTKMLLTAALDENSSFCRPE